MTPIWTNHALTRLSERKILKSQALDTLSDPEKVTKGKDHSTEFRKRFGIHTVTVIAKKNEENEWVILSVWMDPPLPGTRDHSQRKAWITYKRAGFWGKLLYVVRRQIGM